MSAALPVVHVLNPGDVVIAGRGERLDTLLGSCVALLLDDGRGTVGAMCHIVHASDPPEAERDNAAYASPALRAMQRGLQSLGLTPRLCRARLYGGANMFPQLYRPGHRHVGQSNVQRVLDWLNDQRITLLAQSTGGTGYRKLSWCIGEAEPQCEVVEAEPATAAPLQAFARRTEPHSS